MKNPALKPAFLANVFDPQELRQREADVVSELSKQSGALAQPSFRSLSTDDLASAFGAVDRVFFSGELKKLSQRPGVQLGFRLATRMTHTGGTTTLTRLHSEPGEKYVIAISPRVIFDTFQTVDEAIVCGLECRSMRMALIRIMQHEMLHLAEFLVWGDSSCDRVRFKNIASSLLGHAETRHRMLTPGERARRTHQIGPGDTVRFEFDGTTRTGKINRVNRRATVLVPDPTGRRYSDGCRYRKFYVPLNQLQRTQ